MSTTRTTITIKESVTFTLYEADLTAKKVGDKIATPNRVAPLSDGLQWCVVCYPAGAREDDKDHVSVILCVNKPVESTFAFVVNGSSISKVLTHDFTNSPDNWGPAKFASHEQLRPIFNDGTLGITCFVEFEALAPSFFIPRVFQLFEHVPTDVEFAIESERVPAHKNFLSMISPVFQAMFAHKTAESKSGKIVITEFDVDTVKAAIDICYGREPASLPVETIVGILRFCDKYFITPVINELEKLLSLHSSISDFCAVVQYAYDCNKDAILAASYNFFKDHEDEIKVTPKFAELPPKVVVTVLKSAFNLETDFDIMRHAYKNGMEFVMTYLEAAYFEALTIDNFCDVVSYACDCSREELQLACAKFLNEHRDEVENLKAFRQLHSDTIGKVLKASFSLRYGDV